MITQRNQVLEEIQAQRFISSEFEWIEVHKDRIPTVADEGIVSALLHKPSGYNFCFDMRGDTYWATYSPGQDSPEESKSVNNWQEMLLLVREWTANLRREIEAPDLWAMVIQETRLAEAAADVTDDPITQEQQEQIARGIAEIRRFLIEDRDQQEQKVEFITQKLEYLESAAQRMSRRDWLHTAIGLLFTIAVGIGLAPNEARELFSLAANAFANLLVKLLP